MAKGLFLGGHVKVFNLNFGEYRGSGFLINCKFLGDKTDLKIC